MELEKATTFFAEGLDYARISDHITILSADMREHGTVLELVLGVPDVADWTLRYAVLAVAERMEDDHALTVLCFFRQLDEALAAIR